jgi:hypothetical protein
MKLKFINNWRKKTSGEIFTMIDRDLHPFGMDISESVS